VIGDSVPWKSEIRRIADRLEKRPRQRRWTEHTYFMIERDIMIAAFATRKLIDARKLSDEITRRELVVIEHPRSGRVLDLLNHQRFWAHYDLFAGTETRLSLREFCNQIIHSYNWGVVRNREIGIAGLFVSSDRKRSKVVYFADMEMIAKLLRQIADDDIASISPKAAGGDRQVLSLSGAQRALGVS
jgi:hypothetical protein